MKSKQVSFIRLWSNTRFKYKSVVLLTFIKGERLVSVDKMYIPKLTVALSDDKSSYIGIDKADLTKKYYCPCCGGEVFPKALNSTVIKMHFCHRNKSCNNEDIRHFLAKWDFVNKRCIDELNLSYNKAEIEKSFQTKYGKYTPDVTLYLEDGTQIFLEIKNTNPKTSDYILKWCELGCDVIEYDIKNNKFAYLFFNKEFCQKYKITKGEKCQKELLEYVRDNNINEQRFQRLYKFWLACRSKSSNDTLKSLIWEMNIEDSIWCVSQLNKVNCCNETAKTLTSFIKERIISLYQREILNLIRYGFNLYDSYDYDVDGNKINPYVEPIYNEWFYREINEENTRMYTYYLSHLDCMISTNFSYVESTKIYLRIFFEYLLLYKNNKSIIDINNNDIQDFKKFLHKLSISSNQYRCVIGSLYGIIRWKDELKSDCINRIRDLCEEYRLADYTPYKDFLVYAAILKTYVKLWNKLLPINNNLLIDSGISKKEGIQKAKNNPFVYRRLYVNNSQLSVGDVNGDGKIDVLDAVDIQKYSVGKLAEFKPYVSYISKVDTHESEEFMKAHLINFEICPFISPDLPVLLDKMEYISKEIQRFYTECIAEGIEY